METWTVYAEATEWVGPITVTADGTPVNDFQVTVVKQGLRPGAWSVPVLDGIQRGVKVGVGTPYPLLPRSTYTVLALYTTALEAPIVDVGLIKVR